MGGIGEGFLTTLVCINFNILLSEDGGGSDVKLICFLEEFALLEKLAFLEAEPTTSLPTISACPSPTWSIYWYTPMSL